MSLLFLSLIRERHAFHLWSSFIEWSSFIDVERDTIGSNCKSVTKLNRVKNNKGNVSSTFMLMFLEIVNVSSVVTFPTRRKCDDARRGN